MKSIYMYIFFISGLLALAWAQVFAGIDTSRIEIGDIKDHSIAIDNTSWIVWSLSLYGLSILRTIKVIAEWVLIIYLVYTGIQMIMYMWDNEEDLSQAKRQIWYTLVALIFINIPGSIYQALRKDNFGQIDGNTSGRFANEGWNNLLINNTNFEWLVNDIVWAMEVAIASLAILTIVYSGIKMMNSRYDEEKISDVKLRIYWSLIGLAFIGFIEAIKRLAITGDIEEGARTFNALSQFALFFVWPITIFFIVLAGYYYITANGDEERAKKWKNIIINTVIAIVLLLATYTFFGDLVKLF